MTRLSNRPPAYYVELTDEEVETRSNGRDLLQFLRLAGVDVAHDVLRSAYYVPQWARDLAVGWPVSRVRFKEACDVAIIMARKDPAAAVEFTAAARTVAQLGDNEALIAFLDQYEGGPNWASRSRRAR